MPEPDPVRRLESVMVSPDMTIADAIRQLEQAGTGALALCREGVLCGVLTDGDVRRAILRGVPFQRPVREIATATPVRVPSGCSPAECLHVMNQADVHHLPVVDADGRIQAFLLRSDLVTAEELAVSAVIMAGGYGKRLLPLTETTPKPMLSLDGRPLLEFTIRRLREAGIRRVNVTTHHLADRITSHFGDGHDFGVEIHYVREEHPLGTAGGLRLVPDCDEPLLVMNGDVLTGVQAKDLLDYHRRHRADLTVGVRRHELQIPFGVVDCEGAHVRGVREKPTLTFLVNAGIYMVAPSVRAYIPPEQRFDMTDLIGRLLEAKRPVVTFPITEYWMDIGRRSDYEQARDDVRNGRVS